MSGGVRVEVVLLDGRRLEMSVGPRLHTHELLAMVASHFLLKEPHYFSLAYVDTTGHYQWLLNDRRVTDHDVVRTAVADGSPLLLYFLVKFYVSIALLRDVHTVELFYLQAKNLVYKSQIEVDSALAFQLAALAIQASCGDFVDETCTRTHHKKAQVLPQSALREHPSIEYCEERIAEEHRSLTGVSRGDAIVQYMILVERLTTYGVHYYEVRDRSNLPWFLGISHRGISQYDYLDRRKPRRVFLWKQLENLYFRERKFSIEVHDPKRVSVSRRSFGPGNVSVYAWYAETQVLCKGIWSMAIAQHQFYLDRKTSISEVVGVRELPDLAVELSRSRVSLSTHSSSSNLSHSGSQSSLVNHSQAEDSESSESMHQARKEMYIALQARKDALEEKLKDKTEELRLLCLREGELTGALPAEYPTMPGEPPPTIRKRVGTAFTLNENLINKIICKQEESVAGLELEYEIQAKITSAALRLANETTARKAVRKQRKMSYQQSAQRLKEIESKLKMARTKSGTGGSLSGGGMMVAKQRKKPRPVSDTDNVVLYEDTPLATNHHSTIGNTVAVSTTVTTTASNGTTLDLAGVTPSSSSSSASSSTPTTSSSPVSDPLGLEGVNLSPSTHPPLSPRSPLTPSTPVRVRARRDLSPGGTKTLSAPASPHKQPSTSSSSSGSGGGSRSASPSRPHSGYIPSSVFTRSQYRTQQYPTLSTRSQSVPADEARLIHNRNATTNGTTTGVINNMEGGDSAVMDTTGGLYNIPRQRTSLACQSLDDLDAAATAAPSPPVPTTTPHHPHYHHHQHYRHRAENHDRYGSLDRRRASGGRLESRSMDHLDALPPSPSGAPTSATPLPLQLNASVPPHSISSSSTTSSSSSSYHHHPHAIPPSHHHHHHPNHTYNHHPHHHSHHLHHLHHHHHHHPSFYPATTAEEAMDTASESNSCSFDTSSTENQVRGGEDVVDGLGTTQQQHVSGDHRQYQHPSPCYRNHSSAPGLPTGHSAGTLGTGGQTQSQRGSGIVHRLVRTSSGRSYMETTFVGEPSHNQENIPPLRPSTDQLLPLRATSNGDHHHLNVHYHPPLRPTSSVNTVDLKSHHPTPHSDLPPLKATKSNSDLPPHKVTTKKNEEVSPAGDEPLLSLAEAVKMKKDRERDRDRDREWYETSLDSPVSSQRCLKGDLNESVGELSHNISSSSLGSASSVATPSDPNDSFQTAVAFESPRNHMVISAGTFQPSREVSKPFEMADFYKYSTKFRRQSCGNLNSCSVNSSASSISGSSTGGEMTPLSPVLPPRAQVRISATKLPPPPSPTLVAQHSAPAPQQKGMYQPLTPLTCQPIQPMHTASPCGDEQDPVGNAWDSTPLHQAVPATVTNKRSATLV
ncbi:uncharacterized protein LOC143018952 isoform X2 [Oratosquilla oratoria]|uniref:uncharacterized protein LOC143018952 isoform X2 n=1 Tax=Oratosquilla oratoria TaxID=337810 RepID=UPI003F760B60